MNRTSGKSKKLTLSGNINAKANRKLFQKISDSSSISSNAVSSAQSEDENRLGTVFTRPQVNTNDEQEHITKKLQAQVKELKYKIKILEESMENKDHSLGNVAREKDRALGEIRRLERNNKQLRQQLNDERSHYLEEKEKFCEEMTKYKKKLQEVKTSSLKSNKWNPILPASKQSLINQSLKWQFNKEKGDFTNSAAELKSTKSQNAAPGKEEKCAAGFLGCGSCSDSHLKKSDSLQSLHLYEGDDISLQMAALKTENAKLRNIICEKDERNYELCLRFLRMKHYKNDIRSRFQDLENEYLQVIANLMDKIDEARQEFNFIIDQKFKKPMHTTNAMYLQLVQRNSRMAFENASLRLENQCLKKELNKFMNGAADDRKTEKIEGSDEPGSKGDIKTDSKLRKIKKNVNFKEIRTIYKRDLTFKNSDTDSNYMSKTSTTIPSNGSLRDIKSSESFRENKEGKPAELQTKQQPNFQGNHLPNEILKKIFKRVDTSRSQSTESNLFKNPIVLEETTKQIAIAKVAVQEIQSKKKLKEENTKPIEYSTNESKESVQFKSKQNEVGGKQFVYRKMADVECTGNEHEREEEKYKSKMKKEDEKIQFKTAGKTRCRGERDERTLQMDAETQKRSRFRRRKIRDSCGLQEKMEMSEMELPITDSKIQTIYKDNTQKPEMNPKVLIPESDEDEMIAKEKWKRETSGILATTSKSKSANKINLRDELLEAARREAKENFFWQEDSKLQWQLPKKKYLNNERDFQIKHMLSQESLNKQTDTDVGQSRKPEGSKRFSHRLISTSPEQLKTLLTESQLGSCYRMSPIIVGHATTEVDSVFKYNEGKSEIVLQLVIPASETSFSEHGSKQKATVEKETSMSGLDPVKCLNQEENTFGSDIRLPMNSLQDSNSTVEMVDSAVANDRNSIMLRTLSAPGLLESTWLDSYTNCETRDSSTNT